MPRTSPSIGKLEFNESWKNQYEYAIRMQNIELQKFEGL